MTISSSPFLRRCCYALAFCTVAYLSGCSFFKANPANDFGSGEVSTLRQQVVDFADDYVGTKYRYGGTDPRGFDCSGFTTYVFDQFDIPLNRRSRDQEEHGVKVSLKDVRPGDLLFFRRSKVSNVFHVSLVLDNTTEGIQVVHATSSRGVVIDNISTSSYWSSKHVTARKVLP